MKIIYWKWKVGQGLSNFLSSQNEEYILLDDTDSDIQKSEWEFIYHPNDPDFKQLEQWDQIITSPGIPPNHPIFQKFWNKQISELNFLWQFLKSNTIKNDLTIIWISGTNGKSTTAHILFELLKKITTKEIKIHLTWNFGTPLSQTLTDILSWAINQHHILVMECSSFMLYQLKDFDFDYSILTNIQTDHLDRHPDIQDYTQAKLNIIKYTDQKAFTTQEVFNILPTNLQQKIQIFNNNYNLKETKFIWHHNKANLQSILLLTQELSHNPSFKIKTEKIKELINEINPLEHRLQLHSTINWIKIYDDSICTSAHAQTNALQDFQKKVVLIAGWHDKNDDFSKSTKLFKEKVSYWVFMWKTATQFAKIFEEQNISYSIQENFQKVMDTAFTKAKELSSPLLFSPGCASFGMFKNVYDRIAQFEIRIQKKGESCL